MRRITPRMLAAAAALGGLYALGALLPFWYLQAPASGVPFFPPAGLTVAVLLLTPRRTWPLWLVAIGVAEMAVDLSHGQTVLMALGFVTANVIEPLVGAMLVQRNARRHRGNRRELAAAFVVLAVALGPLVGGAIGGTTAALAGTGSFGSTTLKWWLGDALGVLVVAIPILAWSRRAAYDVAAGIAEDVFITAVAVAVTIVPALLWDLSVAYAVLPVLMWAALRGGIFGVGLAGFGVAFSANWLVATGRLDSLLTIQDSEHALIDLQLFLGVTLLAALAFAVEVAERMRAERVLRMTEAERARAEMEVLTAATAERRRIAAEIHDIVGHALNVMILSAGGARRLLKRDASGAQELLETAEEIGRDAFRELDVALALVDQAPVRRDHGLGDLAELVERLARAGLDIEYAVEGPVRVLPRVVDWSAYRIIQESLTNVAKHTTTPRTQVNIRYEPNSVLLSVQDDGSGSTTRNGRNGRNGRGLVGMRERVAVLGGSLEAGPTVPAGYAVTAELPTERV